LFDIQQSTAMRSIPDDDLADPVLDHVEEHPRIRLFLNADNASFLVTARHVLFKQNTITQARLVNFNQV